MRKFAVVWTLLLVSLVLPAKADAQTYNRFSGPNYTDRVVLTYDDCPDSLRQYRKVLRLAKNLGIGLVIAPTGNCVRSFKASHGVDIVLLARQHGQYVINHSTSHPRFTSLSNSRIRWEVIHGVRSPYVRPPFGDYNSRVLQVLRNMSQPRWAWLWNVDTNDWRGKTQAQVVRYVIRNSGAGDTVLMHLQWNGFSTTALQLMVDGLGRRGLEVCLAWGVRVDGVVSTSPAWLPRRLPCDEA